MSYHGCIPVMFNLLKQIPEPSVIEIGLDKGTTFVPLFHFLAMTHEKFLLEGVDIRHDENLFIMMKFFALDSPAQQAIVYIENSLALLEKNRDRRYDLALVDGDHNYFTVFQELELLNDLMKPHSIIICDDYNGRWSEEDLFYSTRESHAGIEKATPRVETEKHGVKAAVDDFVARHPEWKMNFPAEGEPVLLSKGKIVIS